MRRSDGLVTSENYESCDASVRQSARVPERAAHRATLVQLTVGGRSIQANAGADELPLFADAVDSAVAVAR